MIESSTLVDSHYLKKELANELENIKNSLASGSCTSYDEYRYLVGVLDGITKLTGMIQDLEKKYLKDDFEDAER
tara:strand:+ start:52 stop:273 length:222 start_codon:yes stop_codon:yes gene_type:complete